MRFVYRWLSALTLAVFMLAPASAATWHRADTHHFVIYSDGSKSQLEDFAHELERFDSLLRLLFNKPPADDPNKLIIYLLEDADDVDRLQGPRQTGIAGYYSPSIEGSYAVANRRETRQKGRLSGKRVLFHEYAHHFMSQNLQISAPPWFVEGFAEFVATSEFNRNGEWTFGKPALHRVAEVEYYGSIPIRDLLTKRPARGEGNAFYGWSWALTHMLYSKEMGRGQLATRYLNLVNRGADPLEAAEATFGDLDQLDQRLRQYVNRSIEWNRSPDPIAYRQDISIRTLSEAESEIVGLVLHRRAGFRLEDTRDALLAIAARPGADAEVWYQLAHAEYALAHNEEAPGAFDFARAEAAVDRALAIDAEHALANMLKGQILLEPFDHDRDAPAENWTLARSYFEKAMLRVPTHPWPHYAFASTYTRQGERSEAASTALERAYAQAPESSEIRMAYAFDRATRGDIGNAYRLLKAVAQNPHGEDSDDDPTSQLERLLKGQQAGGQTADDSVTESEEGDDTAAPKADEPA